LDCRPSSAAILWGDAVSTIALSGVPELHGSPATMSPGLRRLAILAAAALHLAVFLWLFHPWRSAQERVPPSALPVTLVFEPPPKPPAPKTPPQPQPQPQPQARSEPVYRQSGPDARTTAPPVEAEPAEEAKPAATTPPPPAPAAAPPPSPLASLPVPAAPAPPKPEPPHPAARPKEEKPPRPPAVSRSEQRVPARMKNAAPGKRQTTGDPYFNAALVELEKHRFYPPLARPLGLAGVARYGVKIDRTGKIIDLRLEKSSGAELLDRAAEKMIRDTERFPPPPPDIPGDPVTFWIEIPMAPR
jgi:periplasmic protein TonB